MYLHEVIAFLQCFTGQVPIDAVCYKYLIFITNSFFRIFPVNLVFTECVKDYNGWCIQACIDIQ